MDKNEITRLYDEHGAMIYKIAFMYLGSREDAEDVVHEVFIKLINSDKIFNSSEYMKAWIIRTTQNRCKDYLRRASRKNIHTEDMSFDYLPEGDTRIDITKQLLKLKPKFKTAVILFYYYSYSVSEISKLLGISESAVKMRLKRAREELKEGLEGYDE